MNIAIVTYLKNAGRPYIILLFFQIGLLFVSMSYYKMLN